jgi:dTDP-4-amino-4,6-dideoxygalactose transaminase
MYMMNIPLAKPLFTAKDFLAVQKPLSSGWVTQGPYVMEFEKKFCDYTKSSNGIAVSSCTTALHLALLALNVGPGDEVIVPAFTFIATANAVEYVGAKPIFCDIDLKTYNMDTAQLSSKITKKTKVIIPVHLFGLPVEMDEIIRIAKKHHIAILEDAACGLGAYYKARHVGTFGKIGCFSFHPRKALTTGEGGMLITEDTNISKQIRVLRDHGGNASIKRRSAPFKLPDYDRLGYNYRMSDIQGALGSTQMDKANLIQALRTKKAAYYETLLKDINWLKKPYCPSNAVHGYQSYVCLFAPADVQWSTLNQISKKRDRLMTLLQKRGIATRQGTHCVISQGYYKNKYKLKPANFPNAYFSERLTIALPLFPTMTQTQQRYVVEQLREQYEKIN